MAVFFALLGTAIGSFLNVLIDRLPSGKSIVYPSSHCDICQKRLSPLDLIPLFSYLLLRGRCRSCHAVIPQRVFWVELAIGLLFAYTFWRYDLTIEFAVVALYTSLFVLLAIIDLEHQLILNKIVYPAALFALLTSLLPGQPGILYSIIGGAIGFVLLLIPAIISRGGMGFGDVKMAALIGLITGFPLAPVALFLGIVSGGLLAGLLILLKLKKRKDAIPFGPFLALGALVTMFWGPALLSWYLSLVL